MNLNQLCGVVAETLNESGYTPAIASTTADFDSFVYRSTGKSVSNINLSKGKKLNQLLTEKFILSDNERKKFLLCIADRIEYFDNSNDDNKYKKLSKQIKNILSNEHEITFSLDELFKKVSLINSSFNNLSYKEKIREIMQVTENLLLSNNSTIAKEMVDNNIWEIYSEGILTNNYVKKYRNKYQCFRHAKDETLEELNQFTDLELSIAIESGLYIIRVIKLYIDNK